MTKRTTYALAVLLGASVGVGVGYRTAVAGFPDDVVACCLDADDVNTCVQALDPGDLSACGGAMYQPARCEVQGPEFVECSFAALLCCSEANGAVWGETCVPHGSGSVCDGVVLVP